MQTNPNSNDYSDLYDADVQALMNQPKHTPGPWRVCEPYTNRHVFPIGKDRDDGATVTLAEVNGLGGTVDKDRANALLIANAPELLEALKEAAAMLRPLVHKMNIRKHFHEHNVLANCIQKAIDKAEGRIQ